MIRQSAFIAQNRMLKGGLHCHTTRSDGKGTPEEVIRLHKEHGYDFLALTDHRFYNYKNYAPETGVTILPGMEMDGNFRDGGVHCYHEVCIGPSSEDGNGFFQDERLDSVDVKGPEDFQPTLDMLHAKNNLTIYCHPEWSNTPYGEFDRLRGNVAMEIWNSGCVIENEMDTDNGLYWDALLRQGQKIWAVATDDGHAMNQHCHGWVMVNAKNDVRSILQAIKDGAFYATTGPEIDDFRIENGKAIVECSACDRVLFRSGKTAFHTIEAEDGADLTKAEAELKPYMPYIRAVVIDREGRCAWTNPIFLDRN